MLAIRLPVKMEKRLTALAKKTGRTKTYYAREAISEHLGDLEDLYVAEARLDDIDSGRKEIERLRAGLLEIAAMGETPFNRQSVRAREILINEDLHS